jgi:hypothetical protein
MSLVSAALVPDAELPDDELPPEEETLTGGEKLAENRKQMIQSDY